MLLAPAWRRINLPTSVDPVKVTMSTSPCSASGWPTLSPKPGKTFSTPSGRPASLASAASRNALSDDCSAGFRMTELPASSAGPIFHAEMIRG